MGVYDQGTGGERETQAWVWGPRLQDGEGRWGGGIGLLWAAPAPAPPSSLLWPSPHLVLGQQLAPPVGMGDVVEGEAQVMVTVLKQQGFWLLH